MLSGVTNHLETCWRGLADGVVWGAESCKHDTLAANEYAFYRGIEAPLIQMWYIEGEVSQEEFEKAILQLQELRKHAEEQ